MSASAHEIAKLHQWLAEHEQDLLNDLLTLLRFPSEKAAPEPGAPFGSANRDALEFALGLGDSWGMRTANIEGMVGYAEFGSGDPLIVSLGHVDVVPTGPGWASDPYAAEIREGYIYARGSVDDKGPTMASYYAARAIQSCFPDIGARIRLIFGCDEESGMTCVQRYVETEEKPTFGIAPDAMWPCVHAEKGIASFTVSGQVPAGDFRIINLSGGQRLNIVIDALEAEVEVAHSHADEVERKLKGYWDANVAWHRKENYFVFKATGKAAHGSTPFLGDSAATRMFRLFLALCPVEDQSFFTWLLGTTHPSGVGLGLHLRDADSHDLTSNLGIVRMDGHRIDLSYNIRYPVTLMGSQIHTHASAFLEDQGPANFEITKFDDSSPLYFPKDHPLVHTIVDVVEQESGERMKPQSMGGGTYARMIPNTVAVGTGWSGDGHAHEIDERLKVDHLYRMSRIYATILYSLALKAMEIR